MEENKFPKFWFEGNLGWGWITSMNDFERIVNNYNSELTKDQLLDLSMNAPKKTQPRYNLKNKKIKDEEIEDFGLRGEHNGNISLREFLIKKGVKL